MSTELYSEQLELQYNAKAKEYAALWDVKDEHVIHIIASVMMHRDDVLPGGGFVESVVNNNLSQAINKADTTCYQHLKVIVAANNNCYI